MIIAIDGMGGDNAPEAVIKGCIDAINEYNDLHIMITGPYDKINEKLNEYDFNRDKIEIIDAKDIITNNEHPVMAIRRKKESSLYKALHLVKDGKADAVISAGSTGALMAGATLMLGRIKGIDRVALSPIMPGKNSPFMVSDAGANVDCKPQYLLQFALMGKVYFENILNVKNPTIGLVNIGSEAEKGNDLTKNTYKLLKESGLNFVGNVEPREASNGDVNVLVCDGFVGNTLLKMYEGVAINIFKMLKSEMLSSTRSKMGALLLKPALKEFAKKFDYSEYGGSPFLGSKGIVIKAHGSSNAKAFKNAIKQAKNCKKNEIITRISNQLEQLN